MGRAANYNLPLKKLNSKWTHSESKSRSQAKTLVEYFDAVLPDSYASLSSPSEREGQFKVVFDCLISAMSKHDLKPRNPDTITYPSFYEHYLSPFIRKLKQLSGQGARGKKRTMSSFVDDIHRLS